MHRVPFLPPPPSIAFADEPLGMVDPGARPPISRAGFELVPAWQARRARGRRRALATAPVLAVGVAVALAVDPGHDPAPVRAGPVRSEAPARPALVVQASPAPASDVSRAR